MIFSFIDTLAFDHRLLFVSDVAGGPLSHTHRFILDPPIIDTPYFAELHANALPASFSGSDHLICFNADPEDS